MTTGEVPRIPLALSEELLPAVMFERFGDMVGFVGRPKVAAAE